MPISVDQWFPTRSVDQWFRSGRRGGGWLLLVLWRRGAADHHGIAVVCHELRVLQLQRENERVDHLLELVGMIELRIDLLGRRLARLDRRQRLAQQRGEPFDRALEGRRFAKS